MNTLFAELAQDHRDALVAYYLGQIVPQHTVPGGSGLVTEEDLYEFLLIDHQVNANVDGSRISMAMASVQQYIHAILNGMEPGYEGLFDGSLQQLWRESMSEYAVWAANQMLQDYPENYIEPGLRLKQTSAFREFINDTNQSRISSDSVQRALQHYLGKFEHISNLKVQSGYIDGLDFHNSDYYLIGRQSAEPHAYYWRKVAVRFGDNDKPDEVDDYLSPTAWSEWLPVEIPKGNSVLQVRPLVVNRRLHVSWIEHQRVQRPVPAGRAEVPGLQEEVSVYSLHLSYCTLEGTWSVPAKIDLRLDTETVDEESVFIAFVSDTDPDDRKLVFAYGNPEVEFEAVILNMRFEVLYHGAVTPSTAVPGDQKAMLRAVRFFAGNPSGFPHPMAGDEYGKVRVSQDPSGEHAVTGPYNGQLTLGATLHVTLDGRYMLNVQATSTVRPPVNVGSYGSYLLRLHFSDGRPPVTVARDALLNGHFTIWQSADLGDLDDEILTNVTVHWEIEAGGTTSSNHYDLRLTELSADRPGIVTEASGAQFLDFSTLQLKGFRYARLNTLFAKELVARAMVSNDALLSWDTQHIEEPPLPGSADKQLMDFHGANGRYFWELFFHIPHAVAWRLHHEFDYLQAERWLNYLFNPQARIKPDQPPSPYYWSVRPLEEPGRGEHEIDGIADPDAIAYSQPVHYRKAIFTFYVRNLLAYGDMLYRRLTRDSLNEARLMYSRAWSLLGPRPDNRMIGRWEPVTLGDAVRPDSGLFSRIEAQMPATSLAQVATNARPWLELLDSPRFRLPINSELVALWDDLASRLSNLRNNRTIDGKPLLLPLYAPPADPRDLLRAQNSGSGLVQRSVGSLAPIPPYRFRALLPRLQNAAETLSRFGDQVRLYRELKDRALQEELQQSHVLELSQFGIQLQEIALEQAGAGLLALEASRKVIERRLEYFTGLAAQNISAAEQGAMDLFLSSSVLDSAAHGLMAGAGAAHMGSIIVTAFGGGHIRMGAALQAAAEGTRMVGGVQRLAGDRLIVSEQYRRRQDDWLFQRHNAEAELLAIDEQINGQRIAIELARVQLAQANKGEQQAQSYYRFLKTRSTNADLYQWLLSQLSTFYFQAYDAVVSLCLSGEACWQYEMGDYQTRFIQPNVWFDNYYGLTAGEALRLQLLRMESAYLKRFERRQELVRTVSLKALFDSQPGQPWSEILEDLVEGETGRLTFELSARLFDSDYPGHYLRQLVSVSLSLPAVVGPYQDVRAVLTQVSSKTVLKADEQAMNYLYDQTNKNNRNILYNPRASQSICLSRGVDDNGLFQLDFNDERYLPFEGTGALSCWELYFPRHSSAEQQVLLQSLTDIIVQVRYTALDGGPDFAQFVEGLLNG